MKISGGIEQALNLTLGSCGEGYVQMEEVSVLTKPIVSTKIDIDKINTNCHKSAKKGKTRDTDAFLKALRVILMSAEVENHSPYSNLDI